MKRLILMLTIVLSCTLGAHASDIKVTPTVLESFNTSFRNATDVTWTVTENYFKAQFNINEQYVAAYYDQDGHMIALTRNIRTSQLPIALQVTVKNNYEDCWISDLFELTNDQGTSYFITLENADARIILKSGFDSTWTVYKKTSKK